MTRAQRRPCSPLCDQAELRRRISCDAVTLRLMRSLVDAQNDHMLAR